MTCTWIYWILLVNIRPRQSNSPCWLTWLLTVDRGGACTILGGAKSILCNVATGRQGNVPNLLFCDIYLPLHPILHPSLQSKLPFLFWTNMNIQSDRKLTCSHVFSCIFMYSHAFSCILMHSHVFRLQSAKTKWCSWRHDWSRPSICSDVVWTGSCLKADVSSASSRNQSPSSS